MDKTKQDKRFSMVKERHKKTFFDALKSRRIDPQVIGLCRFFEKTRDFSTSSTCSGRIALLKVNKKESKQKAAFLAKWHGRVSFGAVFEELSKKTSNEVWFKQEPFILHVLCRDLENAVILLQVAKECGIKRAGINVAKKGKFLLEIIGTQNMAFPVKKGNKILMEKENFKYMVKRANEKLEKSYSQLSEFEKQCKKKIKV